MFSTYGTYPAAGMFTSDHFIIMFVTFLFIGILYYGTKDYSKEDAYHLIRKLAILILSLEIFKIIVCLCIQKIPLQEVKEWLPLYYCTLFSVSLLLAGFGKGKFKRTGEVFLMTGSIIGGLGATIFPTNCLLSYPAWHYLSVYSFFYHGLMIYMTLFLQHISYIEVTHHDAYYFALLIFIVCVIAYIVNIIFDSNLMFISKNFPGTPLEILYNLFGPFYSLVTSVGQMTLPFWIPYGIHKLISKTE